MSQPDKTTAGPVRSYAISVDGFPEQIYTARSAAQARANCWRAYLSYDSNVTFRQFLRMSRLHSVPNPLGVGDRILVGGLPATRVQPVGQYVGFMRDGSDVIFCSHPADVELLNAEP